MARGGYRPGAGAKKGVPRGKGKAKTIKSEVSKKQEVVPAEVVTGAEQENLTPLEFMIKHMNDPKNPTEFRARMAQAAAPFVHPRAGEKGGKKAEKDEAAKKAGSGRFSVAPGPKVVNIKGG